VACVWIAAAAVVGAASQHGSCFRFVPDPVLDLVDAEAAPEGPALRARVVDGDERRDEAEGEAAARNPVRLAEVV